MVGYICHIETILKVPEWNAESLPACLATRPSFPGRSSIFEGKKAAPRELHRTSHERDGGPSYMCRAQTTLPVCSGRGHKDWAKVCLGFTYL